MLLSDMLLSSLMELSDIELSDMELLPMLLSDIELSDMELSDMLLSLMELSDIELSDIELLLMLLLDAELSDMALSEPLSLPQADRPTVNRAAAVTIINLFILDAFLDLKYQRYALSSLRVDSRHDSRCRDRPIAEQRVVVGLHPACQRLVVRLGHQKSQCIDIFAATGRGLSSQLSTL